MQENVKSDLTIQFVKGTENTVKEKKKNSVSVNTDTVLSPFEVKMSKVIWILHGIKTYLVDNDHKAEKALSWH